MGEGVVLQEIIGTDKRNPSFTICRDASSQPRKVYVFFGAALLEVVSENRQDPDFKMMIARLYNAGVKAKSLTEEFGVARTTMKCWGDALRRNDPEELVRVFAGRGRRPKLTTEIRAFVQVRFRDVYSQTHYNYSAIIREEIREIFGVELCAETLRPLFKQLKEEWKPDNEEACETFPPGDSGNAGEERVSTCDYVQHDASEEDRGGVSGCFSNNDNVACREGCETGSCGDNRNKVLVPEEERRAFFCHHVGVLLFAAALSRLRCSLEAGTGFVQQWVSTVLLGAVNVEQTKLLNFESLQILLGKAVRSLNLQRSQLDKMANDEGFLSLLRCNAEWVGAQEQTVFYYDPHTKQYTGAEKILKGWCPKVRGVDKVLHMDFVHTLAGEPVFVEDADNFDDLRERFPRAAGRFRRMLALPEDEPLTFVLDRGIFKIELFSHLRQSHHIHLVTWEKGYQEGQWDERRVDGRFLMTRTRNSSTDLQKYRFSYIDRPWKKDPSVRQLVVLAANPKGVTVEVSVLVTDPRADAESVLRAIFTRWLQENDFKYMDRHFGINEITSYAVFSYADLIGLVEDRNHKSGQFKALSAEKLKLKSKLGKALTQKHLNKRKAADPRRELKIEDLTRQIREVEAKLAETERETSRLDDLVEKQYSRLDTRPKSFMDAIKIVARNIFYKALDPFRQLYDNYRDDHTFFRDLSRSHGCLSLHKDEVEVILNPTPNYAPHLRRTVETYLADLNQTRLPMPDGSGRTIRFSLTKKSSPLVAIDIRQN